MTTPALSPSSTWRAALRLLSASTLIGYVTALLAFSCGQLGSAQGIPEIIQSTPIYGNRARGVKAEALTKGPDGKEYILYDDMYLPLEIVRSASPFTFDRWNDGAMPVEFNGNVNPRQQAAFFTACRWWGETSNVHCVNRTSERDYLSVVSTTKNRSFVGRIGGAQKLEIFSWHSLGTIAHELGHALGLIHEHQRVDRDSWVRIAWVHVEEQYRRDFERIDTQNNLWSFYDYESIMHYGPTAGSGPPPGHVTIISLRPIASGTMGQRGYLSRRDRLAAMRIYGANANASIVVPNSVGQELGRASVIAYDAGVRLSVLSGPTEGKLIHHTICEVEVMTPLVIWQNLAAGSTVHFNSVVEIRTREQWESQFNPPPPGQLCP
jgi:hypothetical protein